MKNLNDIWRGRKHGTRLVTNENLLFHVSCSFERDWREIIGFDERRMNRLLWSVWMCLWICLYDIDIDNGTTVPVKMIDVFVIEGYWIFEMILG